MNSPPWPVAVLEDDVAGHERRPARQETHASLGAAEGESALGEGARDAPTVAPLEQGKYLDLIKYLQNSLPSLDLDLIT